MFFAIVVLAIGLALILSALGIITGNFWTLFWGILFVAAGIWLIARRKDNCPWCCGMKMHDNFHHNHEHHNHEHNHEYHERENQE